MRDFPNRTSSERVSLFDLGWKSCGSAGLSVEPCSLRRGRRPSTLVVFGACRRDDRLVSRLPISSEVSCFHIFCMAWSPQSKVKCHVWSTRGTEPPHPDPCCIPASLYYLSAGCTTTTHQLIEFDGESGGMPSPVTVTPPHSNPSGDIVVKLKLSVLL